ncbi:TPR-like protein [Dendrothele bispora CBS 962.96]|uniref:TPR-like protein n=1 Tax=Dendrothele bispora (strain CBS 962.96) TaxID=1314807 RepID=A0A4S8MP18_DENBC|nr:TPR-like protein [Dendrothele bispora CBS 962.96]
MSLKPYFSIIQLTGHMQMDNFTSFDSYISSAAVVIRRVTLDNFQISDSYINVLLFITFNTVGKLGLKNKNQRKEAHSQPAEIIGNTAPTTSLSGSNPQISEQIQTSHGTHFFTDPRDNNFTNATITNAVNQTTNYYASDGPSSEGNKITPDMIASATPAVPIVFKGREELVEQGVNILCQKTLRFLAILGAGGMGKTSLALHIMGSDLVQGKFGERCYFIPCELFEDAQSLVQGLIHVMELTVQENQSKQRVLFDHLQAAQDDLVIVLDKFETPWNHDDSIGVKNLLEKIAQYVKVSLVVTMRGPDGPGDIPWEKLGDKSGIPTLAPASAKEAFKAFAGNNLQTSNDSESQIDSLLYQLDYVPLAIKLSAQHVKRIPLEALINMWEKDKTSILTEGRVPGRLTSMFQGEELTFNMSTLLHSSLIYENHQGIKMLAPVREHIDLNHTISQDDIDQLERFYIWFLEDLPENNMQAQPVLQLHINNIEKVFKSQINSDQSKTSCISAINILRKFTRFNSVSIDLIDLILKKNKSIMKEDEVDLKLLRASKLRWIGRFQDAEAQAMSVKGCLNEEDNIAKSEADILGRCFDILEGIYYPQAQYEKAINMNLQAQKYFKQSENQWAQANSMSWLGDIYYMQDRYKEASKMLSEAQQLFQQIENELGVAECLQRLGDIYLMQGRYEEAIGMLSDTQKQFETFGDQLRAAECLLSLGEIYRMQKKYGEATEMTLKAQKQYEEIGDKLGVAEGLEVLGKIYMNQAQFDEAVDMLSKAQIQYKDIDRIVDVAWCYRYLGTTYRLQEQYEKAKEAFTEALELFKEFPGEKYRIGHTLLNFGHLFFDMKDFAEARRKYEEARDIFYSHGHLEKDVDRCSEALANLDEAEASGSIS